MALTPKKPGQSRANAPTTEATPEDVSRINFNVPISVKRDWKIASAQTGKSLTNMIVEAMEQYLKVHKTA